MRDRFVASLGALAIVMAVVWLAPVVAAQAPSAAPAKTAAAKTTPAITWTAAARTPDGQPDLQGYWTSLSFTPMERAAKYGGREFLTEAELAEVFKSGVQHSH